MPSPSEPAPPLRAEVPDAEAAARDERGDEAQDRLAPLGEAAAAGRWAEVALRLAEAPPHEASAGGATLLLSAMLDEARADGSGARRWLEEAGKAGELPALVRAVDRADVGAGAAVRAHDRLARAAFDIGDERSAALFLVEAARLAGQEGIGDGDGAERDRIGVDERLLEAAARDPASIPAAMARRRWLLGTDRLDEAATVLEQEAAALLDPGLRVRALMRAAAVVLAVAPGASDAARADRAAGILRRALEMAPGDQQVFTELRDLYEAARRPEALVALFEERIHATPNPFEITSLRLARAEIFAGPLANRAAAKAELAAVLAKEPQHARAVASLADLELADGNDAAAAELYIRRAWSERSPEKLRELFLRLGRIYTGRLPDSKRAVGAYARVLQLDGNNREALDALSRLYLGLGETKNAVAITERLVRLETVPERRAGYLVRLGQLSERAGDPRAAAGYFRRAVEAAPRSLEALGELARFLEKSRDVTGRKALLDETAEELRAAVHASPGDRAALEALAAVLRWRGRTEAAAAATDLVRLFFAETGGERPLLPPHGGRRLAALTYPAADELTFPASVPPAVRQLFLMLGEVLGLGGRPDLRQVGVDRVDRVPPGKPPRDVFDTVAAELGSPAFDLYVRPARDTGEVAPLVVLPGQPAAVVIDARVAQLGGTALRFAAARTGRLLATHLDLALAGDPAGLGAWLGGVIRQFVPDFQLPGVSPSAIAEQASRAAKHLSRKLRQEVMPFAMESSGALDLDALRAGIQDGVNRVGLIASGSAAAALRVILTAAGAPIGAASVRRIPEAQALLEFALSDEHDDLVRALD
jgi:tetratricopeptide (TPR) repeat protein